MIKYFKHWNKWRKRNSNSWMHKLLVLFKVYRSPSLELQIAIEGKLDTLASAFSKVGRVVSDAANSLRGLRSSMNIVDDYSGMKEGESY